MSTGSSVIVRLALQGQRAFVAGTAAASRGISSLGSSSQASASQMDKAFSGLAGPMKTGVLALGAIGGAAAAMGVKYNMSMESSRVAFKQFLGSGKAADTMLARLKDLNKQTPFEFPELADTTKRLLAMGFNAKDAVKQTKDLSNAVAGIGGGGAELQRASLAIGQISSKGRLMAEDLMQLTELGIVGQKDLAKALGMTGEEFTKAMSKGEISSDEALKAISKVTQSNFGDAAAAQSKTFAGQLSNLKDAAGQLLGEAMLPLFNYLRDTAMPALQKAMPTIKQVATAFGKTLVVAFNAVGDAVKFMVQNWSTIKTVLMILAPLLTFLATFVAITKTIVMVVNLAARAQFLWNAILLANPLVLIIAGIAALVVAFVLLYKKCAWFRNAVNAVWNALKVAWEWIKNNWPKLVLILGGPFGLAVLLIRKHWDTIKGIISSLYGKVKDVAAKVWGVIKDLASKLADPFLDVGKKIVEFLAKGIRAAPGMIMDALEGIPGFKLAKKALGDLTALANGGRMAHTGMALVGERGPELLQLPGGSRVTPLPTSAPMPALAGGAALGRGPIVVHVQVDRRTIATAVAQDTADQQARR